MTTTQQYRPGAFVRIDGSMIRVSSTEPGREYGEDVLYVHGETSLGQPVTKWVPLG